MPDADGITLFGFNNNRPFFNGANCQNRYLGLINNWCTHQASEYTNICECKCSFLDIFWFQFIVAGIIGKCIYLSWPDRPGYNYPHF